MNISNFFIQTYNQTGFLQYVRKTSDETVNNDDTLNDDSELKFTVEANSIYLLQMWALQNSDAATDIKFGWSGPAGSTLSWGSPQDTTPTVKGIGDTMSPTGDGSDRFVFIVATLDTAAAAGTLQFRWCQDTSGAGNTTLLAGTTMFLSKVA